MRASILTLTVCLISAATGMAATQSPDPEHDVYRDWIAAMKAAPRGPFLRIRWFCNDGTILAPKSYACKPHGGGAQHGEWTEQTKQLRADGYYIANILADLDKQALLADPRGAAQFHQILIEQFLIGVDDGWILRQARYYRGALQEEGERAGARRLLEGLAAESHWIDQGYAALRIGARLLRHGAETASITDIRQLSANLSRIDADFGRVRNKIHVRPDGSDAAVVLAYASQISDVSLLIQYEELAALIDQVYSGATVITELQALAAEAEQAPIIAQLARQGAEQLASATAPAKRFRLTAGLMTALRASMREAPTGSLRLLMLDSSLALEDEHFALSRELQPRLAETDRATRLAWLGAGIDAMFGAGLIRARQRGALLEKLAALPRANNVELTLYKETLDYLGLVPAWASQRLRFHFLESMQHLKRVEPLAELFIQDQLRGVRCSFLPTCWMGCCLTPITLPGFVTSSLATTSAPGCGPSTPGSPAGGFISAKAKISSLIIQMVFIYCRKRCRTCRLSRAY